MSKRRREKLTSTHLFITAAIVGGLGIFEALYGFVVMMTGDWSGWVYILLAALLIYWSIKFLRIGLDIRGMSMDDRIIAAAIFDYMIRSGGQSNIQVIDLSDDGNEPSNSEDDLTSGTLEALRAARKGNNATD